MRKLGMIGGTSWHSTIDYYRYINQIINQRMDDLHMNPPLLLYSLNVALMKGGNWDEVIAAYQDIAQILQEAGAEAIIICANTPHKVVPKVAPLLSIPILHIADAIGAEARRLGAMKLGLLGTQPVMELDFIKGHLSEKWGVEVMIPCDADRQEAHRLIVDELTAGEFREETRNWYLQLMTKLQTAGAEAIILGCTELPILIKQEDFALPLLDTTFLHARYATDFILGELEAT